MKEIPTLDSFLGITVTPLHILLTMEHSTRFLLRRLLYVRNMQSRNGVIRSGAELLWSERELTIKMGNNLGLSLCAVP